MSDEPEDLGPEEDWEAPHGGSPALGGFLLIALGLGVLAVLLTVSPVWGVLLFWAGVAGWLWWAVDDSRRKVYDALNPAPPPEEDPSPDEEPQFTVVDDPNNPARHVIAWNDKKEDGR